MVLVPRAHLSCTLLRGRTLSSFQHTSVIFSPTCAAAYDTTVYDNLGAGSCVDALGRQFERFVKQNLTVAECSHFCTWEPKCGGYYHGTNSVCYVLGPMLAQPTSWGVKLSSTGGVWPIAKGGADGVEATCHRKIATTTGNSG